MKLPREAQATLAGLILFIILSFFDWQQVSYFGHTGGETLWHGFGIITILVAIAYLIWEIGRAMNYEVKLGEITPAMSSVGLSVLLLVCTVIVFLDWSQYRHWPMYLGTIVAILLTVVAVKRGRDEGMTMPKMPRASASASPQPRAVPPRPPLPLRRRRPRLHLLSPPTPRPLRPTTPARLRNRPKQLSVVTGECQSGAPRGAPLCCSTLIACSFASPPGSQPPPTPWRSSPS